MVPRVRGRLVNEINRFTIQCHKLTLESNVPDFRNVLFSVTPVIFKKEGDRGGRVPVSTVQGHFKNIGASDWLRNFQDLRWFEF